MGGGSKSTSETGSAQKWAQPIAQNAANSATGVYNAAQPGLQQMTSAVQGMVPGLQNQYAKTSGQLGDLTQSYMNMLPSLGAAADRTYANNNYLANAVGGAGMDKMAQSYGGNAASALQPYAASQLGAGNQLNGVSMGLGGMFGNLSRQANGTAGLYNAVNGALASQIPALLRQNGNNPTLSAAQGYANDVMGGKYLNNSTGLQSVIDATNRGVTDAVDSQFAQAGRYGSGMFAGTLGQKLADNEGALRYNDYNNRLSQMDQMAALSPTLASTQQQLNNNGINQALGIANTMPGLTNAGYSGYGAASNMAGALGQNATTANNINSQNIANYLNTASADNAISANQFNQGLAGAQASAGLDQASYNGLTPMYQAAGMIPTFASASYSGLPEMLNTASTGAQLPYTGMNAYSNSLGTLFNGGTQVTKQSNGIMGGLGTMLGGLAGGIGSAGGVGAFFSDRRLKTNIRKVGELEDGLGVYDYDYVWGESMRGVMADEVAELRPWALGPVIGGYATVNYGAL